MATVRICKKCGKVIDWCICTNHKFGDLDATSYIKKTKVINK